ncbi:MAG: DUF6282 family protein [Armatimonadota bacterium]|nr:DUF6282 family protein [Armatimonadota bacterium]MDR7535017.1 DUF6282 family protein [Armatimonadota bacterium]
MVDLTGAFDMHVHAAPDVVPRRLDDLELARRARDAGLAGVLLKSHHGSTVERALLATQAVPGARVFGGLVLNDPVGGLNPAAVETALRLGAREIWMPTQAAWNHRRFYGEGNGMRILDAAGQLRPEVHEILRLIATADVILGTGHLSGAEIEVLVTAALAAGVRKVLITHPETHLTWLDVEAQRDLARRGVFFERCLLSTRPDGGSVSVGQIAEHIRQVGAGSTVLATDYGQPHNPCPVDGLRAFVAGLRAEGISERDLEVMTKVTPRMLLGAP